MANNNLAFRSSVSLAGKASANNCTGLPNTLLCYKPAQKIDVMKSSASCAGLQASAVPLLSINASPPLYRLLLNHYNTMFNSPFKLV